MTVAKIYLPKEAENYDGAAQHVRRWFANDFGGWTEYDGRGGWVDENGQLVDEPVTVFETVTDDPDVSNKVEAVAVGVKHETDEDAVMAVVGGDKILVS